jgi:hypothetical protein
VREGKGLDKRTKRKLKNMLRLVLPIIIGYSALIWFTIQYNQLVVTLYGPGSQFDYTLRVALVSVHVGFFVAVIGVALALWYWDEGVRQKTL